jgi:hypothetical protein
MGQIIVGIRARDAFVVATNEPDDTALQNPSGVVALGRVCLLVEEYDPAKQLVLTDHLRGAVSLDAADAGFDALSLELRNVLLALRQADPASSDQYRVHIVGTDPTRYGGWHYSYIQATTTVVPGNVGQFDVQPNPPHWLGHDVFLVYGPDSVMRFLCHEVNPAQLDVGGSKRLAMTILLEMQMLGWLPPAIAIGWFGQDRRFRFAAPAEVAEMRQECAARLSRAAPAFARLMAELRRS